MSETNLISESIYIDPVGGDSQISFKINRTEYEYEKTGTIRKSLNASVLLSDCNRRIVWYFTNDADSVEKINRAIKMLQEFKRHLLIESKKIGK